MVLGLGLIGTRNLVDRAWLMRPEWAPGQPPPAAFLHLSTFRIVNGKQSAQISIIGEGSRVAQVRRFIRTDGALGLWKVAVFPKSMRPSNGSRFSLYSMNQCCRWRTTFLPSMSLSRFKLNIATSRRAKGAACVRHELQGRQDNLKPIVVDLEGVEPSRNILVLFRAVYFVQIEDRAVVHAALSMLTRRIAHSVINKHGFRVFPCLWRKDVNSVDTTTKPGQQYVVLSFRNGRDA